MAVKVLNNNLSKNIKEQFMAEVATTEGTYHIDLVRLHGFCFDLTMWTLMSMPGMAHWAGSCLVRTRQLNGGSSKKQQSEQQKDLHTRMERVYSVWNTTWECSSWRAFHLQNWLILDWQSSVIGIAPTLPWRPLGGQQHMLPPEIPKRYPVTCKCDVCK